MENRTLHPEQDQGDMNIVEIWLRNDPIRLFAGAFGGLVAGVVAMAVAMFLAQKGEYEVWFPVKLMATMVLGAGATEIGMNQTHILAGVGVISALCMFWGVIYAHFTGTNSMKALLPMGLVFGIFSWIFLWNLFFQSFKPIFAAQIPSAPVLAICVAYGLSLSLIGMIDPFFRKK